MANGYYVAGERLSNFSTLKFRVWMYKMQQIGIKSKKLGVTMTV